MLYIILYNRNTSSCIKNICCHYTLSYIMTTNIFIIYRLDNKNISSCMVTTNILLYIILYNRNISSCIKNIYCHYTLSYIMTINIFITHVLI